KSLRKTWFFPSEEKPLPVLTALPPSFTRGTMPVLLRRAFFGNYTYPLAVWFESQIKKGNFFEERDGGKKVPPMIQ
ncbi:MAG: hypothetical protein JW755_10760, partial [Candidatus Aminicenantes bacterium]|nr:hypothetical protein [Candidatus Aminicenantes bacterium]